MNQYLALFIYLSTMIYFFRKLTCDNQITKWDYLGPCLSYAFFGLAWVLELFLEQSK